MTRYLPFVVLVGVLAAIAAITPATASANDAAVVTSVKKWTEFISPKAATLGALLSPNTSSARALVSLESFRKTAHRGAAAISTTEPSSANGARLKLLAKRAFVDFAKAGDLMVKAVQMRRAGRSKLDVTPIVTLLSAEEVVATVRDNPLSRVAKNPSSLLVVTPHAASDLEKLRPLLKRRWAPEALALGKRVAYVWCGAGIPRSPLWNAVDRALERTGTARNMATFTKLKALVEESRSS